MLQISSGGLCGAMPRGCSHGRAPRAGGRVRAQGLRRPSELLDHPGPTRHPSPWIAWSAGWPFPGRHGHLASSFAWPPDAGAGGSGVDQDRRDPLQLCPPASLKLSASSVQWGAAHHFIQVPLPLPLGVPCLAQLCCSPVAACGGPCGFSRWGSSCSLSVLPRQPLRTLRKAIPGALAPPPPFRR